MPSASAGFFYVTPARLSQIMGLVSLAPDIQEAILMLPKVHEGRDTVTECDLRAESNLSQTGLTHSLI
jgi:hypothetical protein